MVTPQLLETRRLRLELLTMADLPAIYELARDRKTIEDFQYAAHSLEDVRAWLEPDFHDPATLLWVIRRDGRAIGLFEVGFEAEYSDLERNVCRIGYFLDAREHNQGLGTEALLAVVDWLFRATDIERIEAGVTLHNVPSYRILEKAGFIREKVVEGNWPWYDQVYDSAYYYLPRPSTAGR